MKTSDAVTLFAALASEARLTVWRLLLERAPGGLSHGDLAAHLGMPKPTLSFHLRDLRLAGLVESRKEGRSVVYTANALAAEALAAFLMETCCGGRPHLCSDPSAPEATMSPTLAPDKVYNVLFLCTGNSARSILAEAILQHEGKGRFRAFSAGSHPRGEIWPEALALLAREGLPTGDLRSKSWDEFAAPGAPPMDFVFTVCDSAADEVCPVWPGQPVTAHWGLPDPAAVDGGPQERAVAFAEAYRMLSTRIGIFCALPLRSLDGLALQRRLRDIGTLDTADHDAAS